MKKLVISVVALVLLATLSACSDQVQKTKPPAGAVKPDATMPPGHPPIDPHGDLMAGHGGASKPARDPFAEAHAGGAGMGAKQIEEPERVVISGEISIDPSVPLGDKYVVYVTTVYGPTERAPVLIKRFDTPKFPFQFELREKDVGMGARQSDKPLYLRAMISDTGDALQARNRTVSEQAFPVFSKDAKLKIKP